MYNYVRVRCSLFDDKSFVVQLLIFPGLINIRNFFMSVKSMKLSCDTLLLSKWSIASNYGTILYIVTQLRKCTCNIFIYFYSQVCIIAFIVLFNTDSSTMSTKETPNSTPSKF